MSASKKNTAASLSSEANYNVAEVLKIVNKKGDDIEVCQGKDVVVFFGVQQVGKSTSINTQIVGPLLKVSCDMFGNITFGPRPDVPKELVNKMAKTGTGSMGCTKAPKAYLLDDGLVLLDTRGMFDVRYPNEMIASIILTQKALKLAKSVRVVFLQRVKSLQEGVVGMRPFGEVFGKLVTDDNIPALFLFNGFPAEGGGEERQNSVMTLLVDKWKEKYEEYEVFWSEMMDRVIQRIKATSGKRFENVFKKLSKEDFRKMVRGEEPEHNLDKDPRFAELIRLVMNDDEFRKNSEEYRYLKVMKKAFDDYEKNLSEPPSKRARGPPMPSIGFLDPTDEFSVNELRRKLRELPPVSVDVFDFSQYSGYMKKFLQYFSENIYRFLDLLRGQQLLFKYPPEVISELLQKRRQIAAECNKALEDLEKNPGKQTVAKYEKKYGKDSVSERVSELEKEKGLADSVCEELRGKIDAVINQEPQRIVRNWNVKGYHPQYRLVFEMDAPFTFKVDLGEGTEEAEVYSKMPPKFDVVYSNGSVLDTAGHIGAFILSIAVHFVPPNILPEPAKILVQGGIAKLDEQLVSTSTGRVVFSVHPKDLPENKRALTDLRNNVRAWEQKAKKAEEQKKAIIDSSSTSVKATVRAILGDVNEDIEVLQAFESFRALVGNLISENIDAIRTHWQVAQVMNEEYLMNRDINTSAFLTLFRSFEEGMLPVVTDPSKVSLSELRVFDLEKHIQEEFQ